MYSIYLFLDFKTPLFLVLVSLTQLVWTMHNICKVWGSSPDHHKKKVIAYILTKNKNKRSLHPILNDIV
jgi:hypothetical protein